MQVDIGVQPNRIFATRSGVLISSPAIKSNRSLLSIEFVPSKYPKEAFFLLKHSIWNEGGKGFVAERGLWTDQLWELLFASPAIYAEDPERAITRRLTGSHLISIPGTTEVSEFGRGCMRSFALQFDDDYSPDGEKLASTGAVLPVMLREKKFDFFCRVAVEVHPTGFAGSIFAIFDEIRGNISVVDYGSILRGPLIAQGYLSGVARFSDCIYEEMDSPPPSPDYCIDLLSLRTDVTTP